jgi:NAD-dependent DNA ligase
MACGNQVACLALSSIGGVLLDDVGVRGDRRPDLLVAAGDVESESKKLKKARELGIKIIDEAAFLELLHRK